MTPTQCDNWALLVIRRRLCGAPFFLREDMKFTKARTGRGYPDTFGCPPIRDFVMRYMDAAKVSVDPFARNSSLATYTNDLNPDTSAQYHMDAVEFMEMLAKQAIVADLVLFDPPYSPRQMKECYDAIGFKPTTKDTQNARLYAECRKVIRKIVSPGAVVLTFGWNSAGMGSGFEAEELLLVSHGSAHNDTICLAERMTQQQICLLDAHVA